MDSVISSLLGGLMESYFSIFFVNFKKEHFVLSTGTSEQTSTLHNLEINRDVVREILGLPSLEVTKMCINTLKLSVQISNIRKVPVVIHIDRLDCILAEPWQKLTPVPTVLEDFLKKLPGGKQSYGMAEKIIDGITIKIDHLHIELDTRGKYKTETAGDWTPPPLHIDLRGISIFTTGPRWEIVDLSTARDYNANRREIFVFKVFQADSLDCTVLPPNAEPVVLAANIPLNVRIVIKKKPNNELDALSMEIMLDSFQTTVRMEQLQYLVSLLHGLSACFGRRDLPPPQPTPIPHATRIMGLQIQHLSIVALEEGGGGVECVGKKIRVGNFWGPTAKSYEKQVEICVGEFHLREFFARTGPQSQAIVEPDVHRSSRSPFDGTPPLPRTVHPQYSVYNEEKPLLYVRVALGRPPESAAFKARVLLNPLKITIDPDTVRSLTTLINNCTPHIQHIQKRYQAKPESTPEHEEVVMQEGRSPLEMEFLLDATLQHVCVAFPSARQADYALVCLNVSDVKLNSDPRSLPSRLFSRGLGSATTFPNAAHDLVLTRTALVESPPVSHTVKFNWQLSVVWTVQFSSVSAPIQQALDMPNLQGTVQIPLGQQHEPTAEVPYPKLEPRLIEVSLSVPKIDGRLTQQQYQAILSRVDQVVLVLPILRAASALSHNVEKPKVPWVFLMHVGQGEWTLCRPTIQDTSSPDPTQLLAQLAFANVQVCVESTASIQTLKASVQQVSLTSLPELSDPRSSLFNPNRFLHTGSSEPLMMFRLQLVDHAPGRLLTDAADGPRAHYAGERSLLDIRLTSLHSGVNPSSACEILNFFLQTEIDVPRLVASFRRAKESLGDVDLGALQKKASQAASEIKVDQLMQRVRHRLDMDVHVDIRDTRVYLVQGGEPDEGQVRGDIAFSIQQIFFGRRVENELQHVALFKVNRVEIDCHKELADGKLDTQSVFSPVSCSFQLDRAWREAQQDWEMTVQGFFDNIKLEVTPSHARVFMDVIHGIKIKNIQEIVNSLSEHFQRFKSQMPALKNQLVDTVRTHVNKATPASAEGGAPVLVGGGPTDVAPVPLDNKTTDINPIVESLEQMGGWTAKVKQFIGEAQKENESLAASLQALEERTGEADILAQATHQGELGMVVGRKMLKRYVAVSKTGMLCVFNDRNGGKPVQQLKINANTELGMIDKIPNAFQVKSGLESAIFAAPDDMELMQWTNCILKLQVAGHAEFKDQTASVFEQAQSGVDQIHQYMDRITEHAQNIKDQAALLTKIRSLEEMVRSKDELIAQLRSSSNS